MQWLFWDRDAEGADVERLYAWEPGGESLAGGDFRGARMRGEDLSGANLTDANFTEITLRGADLECALLQGAHLNHADLRNANLTHADLRGAEVVGADLRGADLRWADLRGVLSHAAIPADLHTGSSVSSVTRLEGADLRWSILIDADLSRANLSGANLHGALYSAGTKWPLGFTVPADAFCFDADPATTLPEDVVEVPGYGALAMRQIPAGTFWMGSADDDSSAQSDEKPRHEVRLSRSFQLSPTLVTQGLYEAVMGKNPSYFKTSAEHPVERVSWFDAVRFCNALSLRCGLSPAYTIGEGSEPEVSCDFSSSGFRLPTEAEWEYAARAGQDFIYSGSNNPNEVGWHEDNSGGRTHPVGLRNPNVWGLYDMSGNVWEWCWDWKGAYPQNASVDPSGPSTGSSRVFRGGSWLYGPAILRAANRRWRNPAYAWFNLGLRLSRS